tara:strand:+ start:1225 stop:1347 length:123 start_codon:yes stop_codon:yes gene_type:complete
MGWQMPPLGICLGLLLISIGIVVGFDIRYKFGSDDDTPED